MRPFYWSSHKPHQRHQLLDHDFAVFDVDVQREVWRLCAFKRDAIASVARMAFDDAVDHGAVKRYDRWLTIDRHVNALRTFVEGELDAVDHARILQVKLQGNARRVVTAHAFANGRERP
jgi:hypothetical protein